MALVGLDRFRERFAERYTHLTAYDDIGRLNNPTPAEKAAQTVAKPG